MEITGTIKTIKNTQTITDAFKKREFVVETHGEYPQPILIEMVQDKCDLLNKFGVGQDVTVSINLRGREWTNPQGEVKYFNSLQGWKINEAGAQEVQSQEPTPSGEDVEGDLPF